MKSFLAAVAVLVVAACSSNAGQPNQNHSGSGGASSDGAGGASACVHAYQAFSGIGDTLPTGSCAPDPNEPTCKQITCGPGSTACCCGTPGYYDCVCKNGTWSCTLTGTGKAACLGTCDDAGTDA